jgi:VWFA-related protein
MKAMRTSVRALVVAAAAVLAPVAAGQTPSPAQVFRAGTDAVTVDVTVLRDRRPVAGLTAADFELVDNGVPQNITEVVYEKLPIDVTLLLDVSASVGGGALDELRRALRQVRNDLARDDRLRLLAFNMRVQRLVDFGQPAAAMDDALRGLRAGGSSAVFDSLAVALTAADQPGRRRLIVLFSDGQDSNSITDAETLIDVAKRSSQTVAVILGPSTGARPASLIRTRSGAPAATVSAVAERLASETGGVLTALTPGEDLSSRFRRTLQEFRASYVLYFTPQGVERSGAHVLDVRVKRAGMDVRARRGYIWK